MSHVKNCLKRLWIISLFVWLAVSAEGKERGRFSVDTGTSESVPAVMVRAESGETWNAFYYELDQGQADYWTSSSQTATTVPLVFRFPDVEKDTYAEVALTTGSEPGKADFRWRTVARPGGRELMDYNGKKELLPPDDFDEYWKRAKEQLDAVKVNARVTRVADKDTSTGLLYRVELDSVENTTIVGWMYVPRGAYKGGEADGEVIKKYPAILLAPAYGKEAGPIDRTKEGYITFAVNPRNHGPSKSFWKSPVEHQLYNITEPEDYFYKLAALDCLQAARFVINRPETLGDRIGAVGKSQGGYLALATAMLEPRIACVAANVISFTDYPDGAALARKGPHVRVRELLAKEGTTATQIAKSLAYTDGANLITRVKCPVQIIMGGLDSISPYVCGVVATNRLPDGVEKDFRVDASAEHDVTDFMREANNEWFDRWLKRDENQDKSDGERRNSAP